MATRRLPGALAGAVLCVLLLPAPVAAQGWSRPQPEEEKEILQENLEGEDLEERLEEIDAERKLLRSLDENRLRARINRYMEEAYELIDAGNADEASELLDSLNMSRLNSHERAMIHRFKAFVAYTEGNQEVAIREFNKALDEEILQVSIEKDMRFSIAQLHASLEQWDETIEALEAWLLWEPDPDPLGFYLMAIAYFQKDDLDSAIEYAEKAIDMSDKPREGWLQLLAALYVQKEDYASAAPVLEELVLRFPKRLYWVQLSLIYGARENYKRSLAVQQVAHAQGLLVEDKELRRLARSYLHAELPFQAAQVLQEGIDEGVIEKDQEAYEMLANSWIAAREYDRSLKPLERAAELSEDGNLFVRLGQVYLQREAWDKAAKALEQAVEKGDLRNPGNALLLLGISNYNSERVATARSYFMRARQHEEARKQAESWLKHLDNEAQGLSGTAGNQSSSPAA